MAVLDRPLMSNEIAESVDLSPTHTLRCLHRLEDEGLVERIERDNWIWEDLDLVEALIDPLTIDRL